MVKKQQLKAARQSSGSRVSPAVRWPQPASKAGDPGASWTTPGAAAGRAPEVPAAGQVMKPLEHGARVAGAGWESRVQACSHLLSDCSGPSENLSLSARARGLGAISVGMLPAARRQVLAVLAPGAVSPLSSLPSPRPESALGAAADLQQGSFVSHTSPKLQNAFPPNKSPRTLFTVVPGAWICCKMCLQWGKTS